MAKKHRAPSPSEAKPLPPAARTPMIAFIDAIARTIDRFGWPGALVIFGYSFVEFHGTPEQKTRLIEVFIFGNGVWGQYPFYVLLALFMGLFLAQHQLYRKRERVLKDEIERLAAWKTAHQDARIDVDLHHTEIIEGK